MTRAIEDACFYLVLRSAAALPAKLEKFKIFERQVETIKIIELSCNDGNVFLIQGELFRQGYKKLFEDYYFPVTDLDGVDPDLVRDFFDMMADSYDLQIEPHRNLSCYEELFERAQSLVSVTENVCDFGCGPATVLSTSIRKKTKCLVGIDSCPGMIRLCGQRGLEVYEPNQTASLCGQFDVVICCYVLHFGIPESLLDILLGLLSDGGVLVANFHKNIGAGAVVSYLEKKRGYNYWSFWWDSMHGRCIAIQRKNTSNEQY